MRQQDLENRLKQQRSTIEVNPAFYESVMQQIRIAAKQAAVRSWRWEDWIGIRPAVQTALWAAAGMAGLIRLVWMIHTILFQGVCYSC
ncbi:MAG: hypothetical protein JW828_00620 [Sedimentisphaerales bacterium]|nr:hypothetical protein [Sedimentisphaerales bacterium]